MTQTDKQAHTPGPWFTRDLDLGALHIYAENRPVAKVLYHMGSEDASTVGANARRIVAAVNACEGLSTEALEGNVVADLLAACEALGALGFETTNFIKARKAAARAKGE